MTKQEEIREGILRIAVEWFSDNGLSCRTLPNDKTFEGDILNYLHSQGVVVKTEVVGEAPKTFVECYDGYYNLLVAVEPLVVHNK